MFDGMYAVSHGREEMPQCGRRASLLEHIRRSGADTKNVKILNGKLAIVLSGCIEDLFNDIESKNQMVMRQANTVYVFPLGAFVLFPHFSSTDFFSTKPRFHGTIFACVRVFVVSSFVFV